MPINKQIGRFAGIVAIGFIVSLPLSYIMTTLYMNIGDFHEIILIAMMMGLLLGLIMHDITNLSISALLSFIFALLTSALVITLSVFPLFISFEGATDFLYVVYLTSASLIERTFIIILILMAPIIMLSGILSIFLAKHLAERGRLVVD